MQSCRELVQRGPVEDCVVRVLDVNSVEGYELRPPCRAFPEGNIEVTLAQGLNKFAPKAIQWVFRLTKVPLIEAHLSKTVPSDDICGAAIVNKHPANVIAEEAVGISADVCPDKHWNVMWMPHEPYVAL